MSTSDGEENSQVSPGTGEGDTSFPPSPIDTGINPLSRFESIIHQQDDDLISGSYQSSETVRRRPTEQTIGYGMLPIAFLLLIFKTAFIL